MDVRSTLPAPPGLSELREAGPVALFLDFDGTLVALAERPDAIHVPAGLGDRLCSLAERLDGRLALVSGRSVADVERHLGELPIACAGSHGIARRLADGTAFGAEPEALPPAVGAALEAFAADHGIMIEPKPHGAALHFRTAPHLQALGHDFIEELAAVHGLQTKRGKYVAELVQPGADKAGAVHAFMGEPSFRGARPIFVGDDVTDEDGFAAASELGGFGILVGDRRPTAARYALPDDAAAREWLGL